MEGFEAFDGGQTELQRPPWKGLREGLKGLKSLRASKRHA